MKRGFTLIEFLIYIAIVSLFLVLVSGFFWNIVFGNIKESSYQEVQQNGRFALTKIIQETKKSTGINSPLPGFSSDTLSLTIAAANLNPTVFKLTNGKLTITKGNGGTYELTSDQVKVSNLQFTNLSYPNTPGTVRIEMTIEYLNPSGRMEYQASINLKSTVSLVSGGAAP
jgi:prepilin-type N-terminal cleavage/methylation domain-containing protein